MIAHRSTGEERMATVHKVNPVCLLGHGGQVPIDQLHGRSKLGGPGIEGRVVLSTAREDPQQQDFGGWLCLVNQVKESLYPEMSEVQLLETT